MLNALKKILFFLILVICLITTLSLISNYYAEKHYNNLIVTGKMEKGNNEYKVFCEDSDGKTESFEIKKTFYLYDPVMYYENIKIGKSYNFTTIGWKRSEFLWSEIIVGVVENN